MNKKVIWIAVAVLVAAYAVYATFFLKRTTIGDMCASDAACSGECLSVGGLGDYAKGQVCTQRCEGGVSCPSPTECKQIEIVVADASKGTSKEQRSYCLK